MAYEVQWDTVTTVSPYSTLDVSNNDAKPRTVLSGSESKENEGMETVRHSALTVAISLAVLWFFGTVLFKNVRL